MLQFRADYIEQLVNGRQIIQWQVNEVAGVCLRRAASELAVSASRRQVDVQRFPSGFRYQPQGAELVVTRGTRSRLESAIS